MKTDLPFELPEPGTFEAALCCWGLEDECLSTLAQLTLAYQSRDLEFRNLVFDLVRPHANSCRNPNCFEKVRAETENTDDPVKKKIYRHIGDHFAIEWVRVDGEYRITDSPEGRTILVRWGSEFEAKVPFAAMEVFRPRTKNVEGHVILDVRSEAAFRDPRAVLQGLDESTVCSIQTHEALAPPLVWLSILGDHPYQLLVRWNGQLKKIANESSFYSRYKQLLRSSRACETDLGVVTHAEDPDLGEEVLTLRKKALKYDPQRSWFSGFLKEELKHRRIDAFRHGEIDLMAHADRIEDDNFRKQKIGKPGISLDELGRAAVPEECDIVGGLDQSRLMARLWPLLSEIERRVLKLKSQGRTDKQIAGVLGLDRSTVTKTRARIRHKGAALLK